MKPRLVIFQPAGFARNKEVQEFRKHAAQKYEVHVFQQRLPEKSVPKGVQAIDAQQDDFPDLGEVHSTIVIEDKSMIPTLEAAYPDADSLFWDVARDGNFFVGMFPLLGYNIVKGRFGGVASQPIADAM